VLPGLPYPSELVGAAAGRSGTTCYCKLFLFVSEKKYKIKAFQSRALKRNAGVFILAVVTLSHRSADSCAEEGLAAAALGQGCPASGSDRGDLRARGRTCLGSLQPQEPLSDGFAELALPKKGFPNPFFSVLRQEGPSIGRAATGLSRCPSRRGRASGTRWSERTVSL